MRSRDTLLLAAEDPAVRAALREILRSDYNLLEAEDRHQAKLLLEQNRDCLAAAALSLSLPGEDPLPQALREGQIPLLFLLPDGSRQAAERALSLGASDVLAPPFLPALVRQRTRNAAELCRHEHHLEELVEEQAQTLRHSNQAVVDALSSIIEFRSAESGRHVLRLRRLTQILLEDVAKSCPEYGLTERDIRGISSAASLHDIGKIAIPDAILNKNQPLSPQEFEVMKTLPSAAAGCWKTSAARRTGITSATPTISAATTTSAGTAGAIPRGSGGTRSPSAPRWWVSRTPLTP